jgi:hypothetical protein
VSELHADVSWQTNSSNQREGGNQQEATSRTQRGHNNWKKSLVPLGSGDNRTV